jgi:hypothetical protein
MKEILEDSVSYIASSYPDHDTGYIDTSCTKLDSDYTDPSVRTIILAI